MIKLQVVSDYGVETTRSCRSKENVNSVRKAVEDDVRIFRDIVRRKVTVREAS